MDELVHQRVVARDNYHKILALILHCFQQRVDRLLPEIVFAFAGRQCIRFIDEQHAAERFFNHFGGLGRRLTDIARHQSGAIDFNQLSL